MAQQNKRRQFLIDPSFQVPFLIYTVGIALTISTIFFGATRYFIWKFREQGMQLGLPESHAFFRFINDQQKTLDLTILIASVVVIAVLIVYGLFLSHRVAGPIYHLKKKLNAYLSGEDFQEVNFREKDFFPELAEVVNKSIRHAQKKSA